ncbi:MAG: hypothetical protein FJ404_01910 [Verrucomicrobia bacterium]|nr:hypothetical protein [Verrucomicrobiota bacterium]
MNRCASSSKKLTHHRFLIASLLPLGASALLGASVPVVNPSFEDISGEFVIHEFTFGALNGWNLYDPANITSSGDGPNYYIGTLFPELDPIGNPGVYEGFDHGAAHGQRVGIAFNFASTGGQSEYGFVQTLASMLEPETTYTLQVEIGNIDSARSRTGVFFNLEGFPGYRVDLMAGGTVLASDNNSLAGAIPNGQWRTSTVSFTTGTTVLAGQHLGIRLVNLNQIDPLHPASDIEVDFDHVPT